MFKGMVVVLAPDYQLQQKSNVEQDLPGHKRDSHVDLAS